MSDNQSCWVLMGILSRNSIKSEVQAGTLDYALHALIHAFPFETELQYLGLN